MGKGSRKPRATTSGRVVSLRWRDYVTAGGRRPVKDFIDALSDDDVEQVAAAMKDVRQNGPRASRHLRGEISEVRAEGVTDDYRILYASQGRRSQVLLALVAVTKHTQKTPDQDIELAERRLRDWMQRGVEKRSRRTPLP